MRRYFDAEIRALRQEDDAVTLKGHAAVFNNLYELHRGVRERVLPGAFKRSLEDGDVRALWNHNSDFVLGRTRSGTLRLSEDDVGLAVEIDLPNTGAARDATELIERGDVTHMSFGFSIPEGGSQAHRDGDDIIQELVDVNLFEVSPVPFPANEQTSIALRSDDIDLNAVDNLLEAESNKRIERLWAKIRLASM